MNKKLLAMFVLLLVSLVAVSESKATEKSPDAEIIFLDRFGIMAHFNDKRINPMTELNYSVWFNFTYKYREPTDIYHNGSIYPGLWVSPMTRSPYLFSFGRFSVEAWAGNTYANATGWFIGPFTRLMGGNS